MFKCLNVEAFPQVQFAPHLFQNYLFFDSMMGSGEIQIRSRICFYSPMKKSSEMHETKLIRVIS